MNHVTDDNTKTRYKSITKNQNISQQLNENSAIQSDFVAYHDHFFNNEINLRNEIYKQQ